MVSFQIVGDSAGNLYFADTTRVRKIVTVHAPTSAPSFVPTPSPSAMPTTTVPTSAPFVSVQLISTLVGTGEAGFSSGDHGPASQAKINGAVGVAVDSLGNLYFSDQQNHAVRMVSAATSIISTIAGGPNAPPPGPQNDKGPATSAGISFPIGLFCGTANKLFVGSGWQYALRVIDLSTGLIDVFAGNYMLPTNATQYGEGTQATSASIAQVWSVWAYTITSHNSSTSRCIRSGRVLTLT
jgi:hypothetical protein